MDKNYNVIKADNGVPIKIWNKHVRVEDQAIQQLKDVASMSFVKPYVAAMSDCHWGMGATVGSVIPTVGAVMPAAVGVDIGCGMMAVRTNLKYNQDLIDAGFKLNRVFEAISNAVPHGRTNDGGPGDIGAWPENAIPQDARDAWNSLESPRAHNLFERHKDAFSRNAERHMGTLGTGNHFIEVCIEIDNPDSNLWVVIHSGSRGLGNRIGTYFTKLAGDLCKKWGIKLPNKDLGYLPLGTPEYDDYIAAVTLAQRFAWLNREIMMDNVLHAIGAEVVDSEGYVTTDGFNPAVPPVIHMHHNYAEIKGDTVLTRKGAVNAEVDKWVIIPGSMGAKTYIGRGLGNPDSFHSCSHGAGRAMSRTQALKTFTVQDHETATAGVFCDKTLGVLDETPGAYKDIDAVMESQRDLVEPVLKIKQLVCVKGLSD
jgi:tRNA-splicing ligase RtcB